MANENFTPHDHKWTVRYGFPEDHPVSKEHYVFFGDEYNWTSMVPLLWQALESPAARILPPKANVHGFSMETCAWWNGALHLLAFGMGWVDIAKGLREWRESGYSRENAVLRLIYDTYGPSIEALEYWLNGHPMHYVLAPISIGQPFREIERPFDAYLSDQLKALEARVQSGPRHRLTQELLNWNDHLHLTGHFPGSVAVHGNPENRIDEFYVERESPRAIIRPRLYAGWYSQLIEFVREHTEYLNTEAQVSVVVSRIGSLGRYAIAPGTGRAYRLSPGLGFERDQRFHWMGN